MSKARQHAKTPSPRTGFLATLANLLHPKGTAAPSYRPATSAGHPGQAQSPAAGASESPSRLAPTRLRHLRRHLALSAAGVLAIGASALLLAAPAQANFEQVATFGTSGEAKFPDNFVNGVAVNDATTGPFAGDVYTVGDVPEVRRYGPKGEFLESWGYGVVRSGPDVAGVPTEAQFTVKATGGTFALNLGHVPGGGPGTPVPFDATHEEVQAALLSLLQGRDPNFASTAEVTVTGGPGDGAGSNPYSVTFGGSLRGRSPQLIVEASGLTGPGASAEITALTSAAAAFETCFPANGDVCERATGDSEVAPAPNRLGGPLGVAVDQATGNVYVLNRGDSTPPVVQEFSPDGSQLLAAFGERGEGSAATEPEKVHFPHNSGIAVDESGNVYLTDDNTNPKLEPQARVMVFKPKVPGVYTEYEYAAGDDIATGYRPNRLAVDSAGDLYFTNFLGTTVEKFTPADPDHPAWSSAEESNQGIQGLAVDPTSGEAYYYNEKKHLFHRLNSTGEEIATFKGLPTQVNTFALAFDPNLSFEAERPAGTLYAVDNPGEGPPIGYIYAHAVIHPPSVDATSVSAVGTASAALGAQIDPHGFDTTYRFQYLTQAEFEANGGSFEGEHVPALAPLIPADLGSANADVSANATVSGLTPDTAYRFRVLASSEEGQEAGPDLPFHTFAPSAGLLDHRAYELVSPPQKDGGEVFPANPGKGCGEFCKPGTYYGNAPMQAAPDGESVVYEGFPFCAKPGEAPICAPGIGAITENSYLSTRSEGGWRTTDLSPELATKSVGSNGYKAFSTDLSRALLTQRSPSLSPLAPPGYPNLYSQPTADPASLQPLLGFPPPSRSATEFQNAYAGASADLSRVVFSANDALTEALPGIAPQPLPGESNLYESHEGQLSLVGVAPGNAATAPNPAFKAISADGSHVFFEAAGHLYARINGEETLEVKDPGHFLTTTPDGAKVLLDDGCLYGLGEEECEADLSQGEGGFLGIAGTSTDLSSVYFIDTAVLPGSGENERHEAAQAGKDNLYLYRGGASAFITTLAAADSGDWAAAPFARSAEASPGGRYLAFTSVASLSGYENAGRAELFEYDSQTQRLVCASCNPSLARPLGSSSLPLIRGPFPQPNDLTDSGRLFFDSADSLSPADTNGSREDVYEYEPKGAGSCESESENGGCLALISAGHGSAESNFLAADPSGRNVFFTTPTQLLPADKDDLFDLYDAREGGGIAAETEPAHSECQGAACQHPSEAPTDPTPASSNYEGPGNVEEPAPKPKKHHHRKHHKSHRRHNTRAANHNRGAHR